MDKTSKSSKVSSKLSSKSRFTLISSLLKTWNLCNSKT